jgi:hypothetical protein
MASPCAAAHTINSKPSSTSARSTCLNSKSPQWITAHLQRGMKYLEHNWPQGQLARAERRTQTEKSMPLEFRCG